MSGQDINSLQEALAQQQQKITALREIMRGADNSQNKSSSSARSSTKEKVKNITKQLTHLKAKAKGAFYSGGDKSLGSADIEEPTEAPPVKLQQQLSTDIPSSSSISPQSATGSEKVLLLRQQMEHNKLRMAQRASSKLHLEQLVSELKEKLDSTQQSLDDTSQLGISMTDLSGGLQFAASSVASQPPASSTSARREQRLRHSTTDLTSQPVFNLEKERIKFLENRCRILEKQLEKVKQTDVVDRISELENLLKEAKEQKEIEIEKDKNIRQELEEKIIELEKQLQQRNRENEGMEKNLLDLEKRLQERDEELLSKSISEEELIKENARLRTEINDIVNNRQETNIENDDNNYFELLELRNETVRLKSRIAELEQITNELEAKRCDLVTSNDVYKEKIQELKHEIETMQNIEKHQNEETQTQIETEMAKQIQELQDRNEEVVSENDKLKVAIASHEKVEVNDEQITCKISNLEATIESQREELTSKQKTINKLEEELMEKTIELNVLNANFRVLEEKLQVLNKTKNKPLFSTASGDSNSAENNAELQIELQQLKQKLDDSNKAMIKLKLKCKQSEKQIEKLKKSSGLHEEVINLQKTNEELQQRIIELEDEKGQWQLIQIKDNTEKSSSDEDDHNLDKVRMLEMEKYEQSQKIEHLEKELEKIQQQMKSEERVVIARVESEMCEIHLEEELEELKAQNNLLKQQIDQKDAEKENLEKKLEHYLNENMELLDKVEKLSKSSSSAESIEIVDRLTQQEHAEMHEFNKRLSCVEQEQQQQQQQQEQEYASHAATSSVNEITQTEMGFELSDSLTKLREESSELMNKVEMFTNERREVLEKMENLTTENHDLLERIEELTQQKNELENRITAADELKTKLEFDLQQLAKDKENLTNQVAESAAQKSQLSRELTSMQKSSEIVAALDNSDSSITLFDKCEKSLSKLDAELEAYRRANDKNAKFNASKKLAKEAKNAHTQLSELLLKVKEASTAVETVTVVETVVAVTAPNGKALAEYEQLTAQNRELKTTVEELKNKLQELEDASLHETISDLVEIKPKEVENPEQTEELKQSLKKFEEECKSLKATVDGLREQLTAVNLANEMKSGEITRLNKEMKELKKISLEFEKMLNDKEMAHAQQIEQFTRLRKELEGKCEVYEGEMEILQTLVSEQKQQLIESYKENEHDMNLKLLDIQQRDEQITKLRTEITELRQASRAAGAELSNNLEKEVEKLRESLRINKALTAEQINELANKQETIDMLNQQLIELYKTMEENTNKVIEKEDEIAELKMTITKNKTEFEHLRKDNEEQKTVVDKLLSELHSHKENKQQIMQLELEVQRLNNEKSLQLEKMKKYAANLKKRTAQCQEFEAKIQALEAKSNEGDMQQELTANVVLLNERISDYEVKIKEQEAHITEIQEALQAKTIEILESMESNDKLEQEMKLLQNELEQRNEAIIQLQNALSASQEQTGQSSDYEQLEKLQKDLSEAREILIIKNQALEEHERMESVKQQEILEAQAQFEKYKNKLNDMENQLQKLTDELSAKSLKFEKSKAVIKERNNQISRLQAQLKELENKLTAQPEEEQSAVRKEELTMTMIAPPTSSNTVPKSDFEALQKAFDNLNAKYSNEKTAFEQTISRLETLHDGIQAKLQEDMLYIETLEQENTRIKEKICKLEECVATFEERRASMERKANLLDAQMQSNKEEYVKAEDELFYRLNKLSEHDEVIAARFMESLEEKDVLQDRLDRTQRELAELTAQHAKLEKEYKNFKEQSEAELNNELLTLRTKLEEYKTEMQRMRDSYDAKLAVKTTEIDELENDLSEQLASMNAEKRELQENLEKSRDECNAYKDEIMRLNESLNAADQAKQESERELSWLKMQHENAEQDQYELQELRMQSMQDKTEIDNLLQQIESLSNNHRSETEALRLQIAELDTLRMQVGQNQTDDQMLIETENRRLTDLLTEKEAIIVEYQRQNLQLQMAATDAAARTSQPPSTQPPDLFASIGAENIATNQLPYPYALQQDLAAKNALINSLQTELAELRARNRDSQDRQLDASNDIIPAPPMFFASNQMAPSLFDDIVQSRRHEQPQYAAAAVLPDVQQPPTIEDLQRNVSDLEKYAQELEEKLAARNNQEEKLTQRMNEALTRQNNAEQEVKKLEEQLQLVNNRLKEREQLQSELENKIIEMEKLLKEREDQLCLATTDALVNAQDSAQHAANMEQRLQATETILQAREADVNQLKEQLEAAINITSQIEAQIIPRSDVADGSKDNTAPSLNMFFGNAPDVFEDIIAAPEIPQVSDVPVVEEVIVPKKAYQCYPEGELDDAWNDSDDAHWGSNEAVAEAKHFDQQATVQSTSLLSREQQLELELQSSNERIKDLENILGDSENQKQKLQEKLAKSLKVVNKYKCQNEELKKNNNTGGGSTQANFFDDLDAAIQDELKQQVAKLESELLEQRKQQKELAVEKEKLLKRIDVVTAGNERMAEMKERQDMDMDMYKMRIHELQQKLHKLEDWDGTNEARNNDGENTTSSTITTSNLIERDNKTSNIQELEAQIQTLKTEVDDLNGDKMELQALLDEERERAVMLQNKLESQQRQINQLNEAYENVCAELEKLKATHADLNELNTKQQKEIQELRHGIESSRSEAEHCNDLKQICMELENKLQNEQAQFAKENAKLEAKCQDLMHELENLRVEHASASASITKTSSSELPNLSTNFDDLLAQLQERDDEIVHLKQRIEDLMREDQTEKLVLEILTKNQEIHMLKIQVKNLEDDKQELEHNLTMQITKEMKQQPTSSEGGETTEDREKFIKRIGELETQLQELQNEKQQMEEELSVLNSHVLNSLEMEDKLKKAALDLDMKNIEIKELRSSLESMRENNLTEKSIPQPEIDVTALNTRWEGIVEQRCSELAHMWRTHLEQREAEFQTIEQRLKMEIETIKNSQQQQPQQQHVVSVAQPNPIPQQNILIETSAAGSASSTPLSATSPSASADSSSSPSAEVSPLHIINEADADELISKMQTALENQEMEIVSLKEQLAIRSAEYARLAAQYDPFKLQTGSSSFDSTSTRLMSQRNNENSSAAVVPKSELDLAMYMLHQRDMRVEEMTIELVALLEERDTLQLKLSNTLRQMEAIKTHINYVEPVQTSTEPTSTTTVGQNPTMPTADSPLRSMTSAGAENSSNELHQKLSQLQTVNHSKDKHIQEDRQQRIRQMERIQQDVARIPPAAVSELIGTDISQSNQSPSSALLNWLWGNKPPGNDDGSGASMN